MILIKEKDINEYYMIDIDKKLASTEWSHSIPECVEKKLSRKSYNTWYTLRNVEQLSDKLGYLKENYIVIEIPEKITKETHPEYWL